MRLLWAALILAFTIDHATAEQTTKIKGFYIGMPKNEVLALLPEGLHAKEYQTGYIIFWTKDNSERAQFAISDDGKVEAFELMKSYFDPADTMKPGEFARGILDHYPIKDTSAISRHPLTKLAAMGTCLRDTQ